MAPGISFISHCETPWDGSLIGPVSDLSKLMWQATYTQMCQMQHRPDIITLWPTAANNTLTVTVWKEQDGWKTVLEYSNTIRKIQCLLWHGKWPKAALTQYRKCTAKIMVVAKWSTGGFLLTGMMLSQSLLTLLLILSIPEMIQTLFWEARRQTAKESSESLLHWS